MVDVQITRSAEPTVEGIRAYQANRYGTATVAGETFHVREYGTAGPRARFVPPLTLQIFMAPRLEERLRGVGYGTLGRIARDGAIVDTIDDPRDRALCRMIAAAWWAPADACDCSPGVFGHADNCPEGYDRGGPTAQTALPCDHCGCGHAAADHDIETARTPAVVGDDECRRCSCIDYRPRAADGAP